MKKSSDDKDACAKAGATLKVNALSHDEWQASCKIDISNPLKNKLSQLKHQFDFKRYSVTSQVRTSLRMLETNRS